MSLETRRQRRWQRLPVAIPVFARGRNHDGKEFLEFTTLCNIGGGGALIALRSSAPESGEIVLEIPAAPTPSMSLPASVRKLNSRVVHITPARGYNLLGVRFTRPLLKPTASG